MAVASDSNSDNKKDDTDNTEFAELIPAKDIQKREFCQGEESNAIANYVSRVCHATMPGISRVELRGGCDIKQKISEGRLQRVQSEVQNVKCEHGKPNCRILDLSQELKEKCNP